MENQDNGQQNKEMSASLKSYYRKKQLDASFHSKTVGRPKKYHSEEEKKRAKQQYNRKYAESIYLKNSLSAQTVPVIPVPESVDRGKACGPDCAECIRQRDKALELPDPMLDRIRKNRFISHFENINWSDEESDEENK
jgi:hypothetical protein